MNITIKTIPHNEQDYPTVGDWRFAPSGDLNIFVSDMNNWKYEALVAIHELIEVVLCKDRNIGTETVDNFDIAFEQMRHLFPKIVGNKEPGDDVNAPYHLQHIIASRIEKDLSGELGVSWNAYEEAINKL